MADMNLRGVVDLGALAAARKQEAASAAARATAPVGVIIDASDATFERDVLQASMRVPVILDFWATWCGPCRQLSPILERLAAEYGGRFLLVKVDSDANPGLSQAFRVQSIPSVFALLGGQPAPLFQGAYPEPQVRQYIDRVLEVAAQNGINGTVGGAAPEAPEAEPEEDPRYVAIHESIEAGHFDAAADAAKALADARDPEGPALVAYVSMRRRMAGTTEALARAAFAAAPSSVAAVLAVSDFDFLTGGPSVTYDRLIAALRTSAGDDRTAIRDRLLEYFAVDGNTPETTAARKSMTAALF